MSNAKRDDNNKAFWLEIAPRLLRVHYESTGAEAELMVAGIRNATDLIEASTSSKSGIESLMETRNKKKTKDFAKNGAS